MKAVKVMIKYRIKCSGNHSGRRHIYNKASRKIAFESAKSWNEAGPDDISQYMMDGCCPMVVEKRTVTEWSIIEAADND